MATRESRTEITPSEFVLVLGKDEDGTIVNLDLQGKCSGCGNLVVEGYPGSAASKVISIILNDITTSALKGEVDVIVQCKSPKDFISSTVREVDIYSGGMISERYSDMAIRLRNTINERIDFLVGSSHKSYYDYLSGYGNKAEHKRMVVILDDIEEAMVKLDTDTHRLLRGVMRSANMVGITIVANLLVGDYSDLPELYKVYLESNVLTLQEQSCIVEDYYKADLYISNSLAYSGIEIQKVK